MPLINAIHESLPYIDTEPTASQRAAALTLITSELTSGAESTPHTSLPSLLPSNLSPLIQLEMDRLEESPTSKMGGIDLTRYESLSAPTVNENSSPTDVKAQYAPLLTAAYTLQSYLSARQTSLSLLETYGKNAWLISNSQLEAILRSLEQELAERKTEIDQVVIARKTAQEAVGGEMKGLEETWKKGVGRILETEVAAEGLRREILERRRTGAV